MISAVSFLSRRTIWNDSYTIESSLEWFITRFISPITFPSIDISFSRSSSFGIEENLSRTNSSSSRTIHSSKKTNEKSIHIIIRVRSPKIVILSKQKSREKESHRNNKTDMFYYLFRSLVLMKSIDALMLHMQIILRLLIVEFHRRNCFNHRFWLVKINRNKWEGEITGRIPREMFCLDFIGTSCSSTWSQLEISF